MVKSAMINVISTVKDHLRKRRRKSQSKAVQRLVKTGQPTNAVGTVIFAEFSKTRFAAGGKITAFRYLPVFSDLLRMNGFKTTIITTVRDLSLAILDTEYTVVVMIYGEDQFIPNDPGLNDALARADLVFNHSDSGKIICNKKATHIFLSKNGVAMPAAQFDDIATRPVFSNHNNSTGAPVSVLAAQSLLDADRYNTEFIDTKVTIDDEHYYTTIRLMCVGGTVTHASVRARSVRDGSASVHGKNTPVNAALLNAVFDKIVAPRLPALNEMAERISLALGPGFYSHDILVDATTGKIYLAETGYKFDIWDFCRKMAPILPDVPAMAGFTTPEESARNNFPAFMDIVNSHKDASAKQAALAESQNSPIPVRSHG